MKKLVLSLTALTLALIVPLTVLAQQGANGPGQARTKTEVLIAVNRAGLSLEQLQTLQGVVQGTLDARTAINDAQTALQDFLINWNGAQADFDAALKVEQQKVRDALDTMRNLMTQNSKTIKDTLSASQFELLARSLHGTMAPPNNARASRPTPNGQTTGPDNHSPNDASNAQPDSNGGQAGSNLDRRGPAGPDNNLNVLLEALNAKIDAINNAA